MLRHMWKLQGAVTEELAVLKVFEQDMVKFNRSVAASAEFTAKLIYFDKLLKAAGEEAGSLEKKIFRADAVKLESDRTILEAFENYE